MRCTSPLMAARLTVRVAARLAACWVVALLSSQGVSAAPPAPRSLQGVVMQITDGDSLLLTPAGKPAMEVRLRDIDAPEICQTWGVEARQALTELALNKVATLQISGKDSQGRTVGVLMIDDLNVGKFLVENGHAWSQRTRWDQGPMVKEEKMARALTRGLHSTPGAVQPKEFLRARGPCGAAEAAAPRTSQVLTIATPMTTAAAQSGFRCDGRVHCSQMTSCNEAKYFLANCPGVKMDGDRNGLPCEQQWCKR